VEYPFAIVMSDPITGDPLDVSLVGIIDLIESDDEGTLIVAELKTSAKRYADSQSESQLDGLIYAYAMNRLGFRTADAKTLIRYDVLIKTKSPGFQQIYVNKSPQDYGRLVRWIQEILQAIERESFYPNFGWACHNCQFRRRCSSI
jgi:CRISPR/Cas system-associated exonuclease Cas4 (RecB family)